MTSVPGAAALRRNGTGWYLYGVVAADDAPTQLGRNTSVDPEHEVVLVTEGHVAGVVSRVSLDEFDETALAERLSDAAWLERTIRAHEQVLEHVLEQASVMPCRFCTVYRDEEELRSFLSDRGDALASALDRVRGQVELGVKAFVDRDRFGAHRAVESEAVRELEAKVSAAEGGRAYLESRRLERRVADELERFQAEVGAEIHSRLLPAAEDGVPLPLQAPEISGRKEEMVFNAAYLVVAGGKAFEDALVTLGRELASSGVHFELTGPWPPYNFVPAELGAAE